MGCWRDRREEELLLIELGFFQVGIAYVFLLVLMGLLRLRGIPRGREALIASFRMTLQLILAGYLLAFVFQRPAPWITLLLVCGMELFAIRTILGKFQGRMPKGLSRAVANLPVLAEYCLPFVRVGGWFGAYKTARSTGEGVSAERALRVLGASIEDITTYDVYDSIDKHNILWFKKNKPTPIQYPRKPGTPAKDPL